MPIMVFSVQSRYGLSQLLPPSVTVAVSGLLIEILWGLPIPFEMTFSQSPLESQTAPFSSTLRQRARPQ